MTPREAMIEAEDRLAAMIVSPWQPIETAPKDGTPFLAWPYTESNIYDGTSDPEVCIGFWTEEYDCWWREGEERLCTDWQPTHWQPLPEPPK